MEIATLAAIFTGITIYGALSGNVLLFVVGISAFAIIPMMD